LYNIKQEKKKVSKSCQFVKIFSKTVKKFSKFVKKYSKSCQKVQKAQLAKLPQCLHYRPSNEFELLGVKYDRQFLTAPHDAMVASAGRQRASLIARLTHHIPRGRYLKQLAAGLVLGKVGHALPAETTPRLCAGDGVPNKSYKRVQTALNDVARSFTGTKHKDRVRVEDLLKAAKILSVNAMSTLTVTTEAWKAFHSRDGVNGGRNPIGEFMFYGNRTIRATRAGT
jgi:hypothetical protein